MVPISSLVKRLGLKRFKMNMGVSLLGDLMLAYFLSMASVHLAASSTALIRERAGSSCLIFT